MTISSHRHHTITTHTHTHTRTIMTTAVGSSSSAKAVLPPREEIIQFIVSGSGSDVETVLPAPLKIPDEAIVSEIGLRSFSMYNSIPNVDMTNRNLLFKVPSSNNWVKVAYPVGAYELKAVAEHLYEWVENRYPEIKKRVTNSRSKRTKRLQSVLSFSKRMGME